jgi:heme/copper-type cytochrome/quinol oxidase subunit 3
MHVSVGLVALFVVLRLLDLGVLHGRRALAVRAVGYYWHFVDVVWLAVFAVVFLRGML